MVAQASMQAQLVAVARLAAQLGRERASAVLPLSQIAGDAVILMGHALALRKLVERGASPDAATVRDCLGHLVTLADRYGADVVPGLEVNGMVVGLRLRSGCYSNGARDIFYLS